MNGNDYYNVCIYLPTCQLPVPQLSTMNFDSNPFCFIVCLKTASAIGLKYMCHFNYNDYNNISYA